MRINMGNTLENNSHRKMGQPRILKFDQRPICSFCNRMMANKKTRISIKVGISENYAVHTPQYACVHKNCPGEISRKKQKEKRAFIIPANPFHAPYADYDYEVQGEVVRLRWQEKKTHGEIIHFLNEHYSIKMDQSAVEPILKLYEIGCAEKYRPEMQRKIQANGGIILCIDVMKPIGGKKGTLGAYDYLTGLAIGSKRLPNGKTETYKCFLQELKTRIEQDLKVPVKAIISDALKEQRKAVADVFVGVPHCLCHYHFFELVLKSAKEQDSHVVTVLRTYLRDQRDLVVYRYYIEEKKPLEGDYELLKCFFEPLAELSQWKRNSKDPCFISILFAQRLASIGEKLELLSQKIDAKEINFHKSTIKMIDRLSKSIWDALDDISDIEYELRRIQAHLPHLVEILSSVDDSFDLGMLRLQTYHQKLINYMEKYQVGAIEKKVLDELCKYFKTKAVHLMNYRKVNGAPRTNNFEELEFKAVKYILRRTLGYSGAKEYLYSHGERILFVNPNESLSGILSILKSTDQRLARQTIRNEREKNEGWIRIMREDEKWAEVLKKIDAFIIDHIDLPF